ncbi:MAG: hypothetical protein FJY07_14755 [Bacteroidetes bacterium]|nr:hypothetical protein [Bacteroidota bacterium]
MAAGDTLIVEGSAGSYGSITVSKAIKIFGPGFLLTENDSTQAFKNSSLISSMSFNSGSEGSVISGLYFNGTLTINSNNITVKNCCFIFSSTYLINITTGKSNVTIRDNYLEVGSGNTAGINADGSNSNLLVYNNVIIKSGNNCYLILMQTSGSNADIYNNILIGPYLQFQNSIFRNNIVVSLTNLYATNSLITNNISNGSLLGSQNGNQSNVNMENVFVCYSNCTGYTPDERYRLKAGSPAINAGYGGVDCGIFDGPFPYSISGLAEIPAIWDIIQNGNQYTIKAKSH